MFRIKVINSDGVLQFDRLYGSQDDFAMALNEIQRDYHASYKVMGVLTYNDIFVSVSYGGKTTEMQVQR